jgi:hypothetical protein
MLCMKTVLYMWYKTGIVCATVPGILVWLKCATQGCCYEILPLVTLLFYTSSAILLGRKPNSFLNAMVKLLTLENPISVATCLIE